MVRITAAAFLAFVAISSATLSDVFDGERIAARADAAAPAAGPEDVKQLDTLIDAVATLQDMLKNLKEGAGGEAQQDAGGEAQPAADGETQPAADGEAQPAADGEAQPATDGEAQPATDGEAQPAADGEQKEDAA